MDKTAGFSIFRHLTLTIAHRPMFPILLVALISSGLVLASGCATIVASGPDMVPVNTQPEGARVTLDGVPVGITPVTVAFARHCDGVLAFDLDAYEHTMRDENKVVNGWVFGNILLGGLIGLGIDLATSNQGKYSTHPIYVELVPKKGSTADKVTKVVESPAVDKPRHFGLKVPIAIINIRTPSELADKASDFSDVVRSEVLKADRYKVMPREAMKERLGEQKYFALKECTDRKCLFETAKVLEVKKVLLGEIGKSAQEYSVSLVLYDAESNDVQWTDHGTANLEAEINSVITALIQKMNALE